MTGWWLRLLGLGWIWDAMRRGETTASGYGPVVKLASGVYDIEIRAVKREVAP